MSPRQLTVKLGAAVDAALSRQESATALGLMRIAIVSVLLVNLLAHVGAVGEYFSDESLLAGRFARLAFPDRASLFLPPRDGGEEAWHAWMYVADPTGVRVVFALGVASHVAWLLGWHTWIAGALSFGLWVSLVGRNPMLYAYPDQLLMMEAFLLALMPSGRGLSLDARRRGGPGTVPVWCRRMIQFELAIIYVTTGLEKTGVTWHVDGTAIYYTLVNPYNRHFAWTGLWANLQPWVLAPATYLTLYWEIGFGAFVGLNWVREAIGARKFLPDLRPYFLGYGVAMHLGIWVLLYTVLFPPLILAAYFSFLTPDEADGLVGRIRRRRA